MPAFAACAATDSASGKSMPFAMTTLFVVSIFVAIFAAVSKRSLPDRRSTVSPAAFNSPATSALIAVSPPRITTFLAPSLAISARVSSYRLFGSVSKIGAFSWCAKVRLLVRPRSCHRVRERLCRISSSLFY